MRGRGRIAAILALVALAALVVYLANPSSIESSATTPFRILPPEAFALVPVPTDVLDQPRPDFRTPTPSPAKRPAQRQRFGVESRVSPLPQPSVSPVHSASGGVLSGTATWYCLPGISVCPYFMRGGLGAAAGPALRNAIGPDWRGKIVETCLSNSPSICVAVKLVDWCACGADHVIDLFADAMRVIDPGFRSNGGAQVTISWPRK